MRRLRTGPTTNQWPRPVSWKSCIWARCCTCRRLTTQHPCGHVPTESYWPRHSRRSAQLNNRRRHAQARALPQAIPGTPLAPLLPDHDPAEADTSMDVPRPSASAPKVFRGALPRRWVGERTFARLSQNRRFSRVYERLCSTSEALIYATMGG
jgi:transposase